MENEYWKTKSVNSHLYSQLTIGIHNSEHEKMLNSSCKLINVNVCVYLKLKVHSSFTYLYMNHKVPKFNIDNFRAHDCQNTFMNVLNCYLIIISLLQLYDFLQWEIWLALESRPYLVPKEEPALSSAKWVLFIYFYFYFFFYVCSVHLLSRTSYSSFNWQI